jgi:hypothetical protein
MVCSLPVVYLTIVCLTIVYLTIVYLAIVCLPISGWPFPGGWEFLPVWTIATLARLGCAVRTRRASLIV